MRVVDLKLVEKYSMPQGIGNIAKNEACVMSQAVILDSLSRGVEINKLTDELECACPLLRIFAIGLNDINWWKSNEERTSKLRSIVPALLDSKVSVDAQVKRSKVASNFAKYAASTKYAAESAAEYPAESAKYAAKYAAESAVSAEYAAEYAAFAKYPANYAAESAKYAAKYAASAKYVASAKYAAKYAAESAKYAAKYAASAESAAESLIILREKMIIAFWKMEAIKD